MQLAPTTQDTDKFHLYNTGQFLATTNSKGALDFLKTANGKQSVETFRGCPFWDYEKLFDYLNPAPPIVYFNKKK